MLERIANMTAAEIRSNKEALIEEAAKATPAEAGRRYVNAELDAKTRDEALAVHAATVKAAEDQLGGLQRQLADERAARSANFKGLEEMVVHLETELAQEKEAQVATVAGIKQAGEAKEREFKSLQGQAKNAVEALQAEIEKLAAAAKLASENNSRIADQANNEIVALRKQLSQARDDIEDAREFMGTEIGKRRAAQVLAKRQEELDRLKAKQVES